MVAHLVTIGIPTHNRFHYLEEAVNSALAQTYENFEVLISQDVEKATGKANSQIQDWCRALCDRDPRVRYQCSQTNLGLGGNWNAIVDSARGDYLIIIGDDDRLMPDCIAKLMAACTPNTVVAFSNHWLIDGQGTRSEPASLEHTRRYNRENLPAGIVADAQKVVWQNAVPISTALLRSKEAKAIKFKADLNCPEIELFAYLSKAGGEFVFVPDFLVEYRYHTSQQTNFGLNVERLATYLMEIEVSSEVEPYKSQFLQEIMPKAVSRCLLRTHDLRLARQLLNSRYYPAKGSMRGILQSICVQVPAPIGIIAYKAVMFCMGRL